MTLCSRMRWFLFVLLGLSLSCGCANRFTAKADLDSTAWMQTSHEYRALTLGAFSVARRNLDDALRDPTWTALDSQTPATDAEARLLSSRPVAVILDIDETVLSSLPYQAWLVKNDECFTPGSWNAWVMEASAKAIPGALEFVRYAWAREVTVFYVSNRAHQGELDLNENGRFESVEQRVQLKPFTISNLVTEGFLPQDRVSNERSVLLRGTVGQDGKVLDGWDSADKSTRRASISSDYRIALIMGDDLNDFIHLQGPTLAVAEATELSATRWGHSWIMLPNPIYGSWERSLYEYQATPSESDKFEAKLESLHSWR